MIDPTIIGLLSGARPFYEWAGLAEVPTMTDGGGADTDGPNPLPHGKYAWKPATTSTPAMLVFNPVKRPPGQPWDNLYAYNTISRTPPPCNYFSWSLQFALSTLDLNGNAREFEIEQCESSYTYNMAWQYKWSKVDGPPAWRLFDQIAGAWIAIPAIPPPVPKANTFISVQALFAIDRKAGVTLHDSIAIDGVTYPINLSHPRKLKWKPATNYLHNATQIDSMGDGQPGSTQIKNWTVRGL